MRKGYGLLISTAREAAGYDVDALAARLGQSPSTIRRLESEVTEPSVDQINALVSALPISAEELLRAMGVRLNVPAAALLPKQLVDLLIEMTPEQHAAVLTLLSPLVAMNRPR